MSGPNYRGRRDTFVFYASLAILYLLGVLGGLLASPRCETLQERAGDIQKAERER